MDVRTAGPQVPLATPGAAPAAPAAPAQAGQTPAAPGAIPALPTDHGATAAMTWAAGQADLDQISVPDFLVPVGYDPAGGGVHAHTAGIPISHDPNAGDFLKPVEVLKDAPLQGFFKPIIMTISQPFDTWPVGAGPVSGRSFSSVGDPHETTGDGLKFDNMKHGDFVKLKSADNDFVLQTRQKPYAKNPEATVNTAAGVKLGADKAFYDGETNTLTINGEKVPMKPTRTINLKDGGTVQIHDHGLRLTSPVGDVVNITRHPLYIDVTGMVSEKRKDGEIRGSLGAFDSDTQRDNELMGRSGTRPIGNPNNPYDRDDFLEEWRVRPYEDDLMGPDPTNGRQLDLDKRPPDLVARQRAQRDFMLADIDNDGVIQGEELTPALKQYDADGDGKILSAEFVERRVKEKQVEAVHQGRPLIFRWEPTVDKQEEERQAELKARATREAAAREAARRLAR
jgi:hypothetical protein